MASDLTEGRRQKAEGRRQKAEGRRQKTEDRILNPKPGTGIHHRGAEGTRAWRQVDGERSVVARSEPRTPNPEPGFTTEAQRAQSFEMGTG